MVLVLVHRSDPSRPRCFLFFFFFFCLSIRLMSMHHTFQRGWGGGFVYITSLALHHSIALWLLALLCSLSPKVLYNTVE